MNYSHTWAIAILVLIGFISIGCGEFETGSIDINQSEHWHDGMFLAWTIVAEWDKNAETLKLSKRIRYSGGEAAMQRELGVGRIWGWLTKDGEVISEGHPGDVTGSGHKANLDWSGDEAMIEDPGMYVRAYTGEGSTTVDTARGVESGLDWPELFEGFEYGDVNDIHMYITKLEREPGGEWQLRPPHMEIELHPVDLLLGN